MDGGEGVGIMVGGEGVVGIMVGREGVGIMVGEEGEGAGKTGIHTSHPIQVSQAQVESLISQPDEDDFGPPITWSSSRRRGIDGGKGRERERVQQ